MEETIKDSNDYFNGLMSKYEKTQKEREKVSIELKHCYKNVYIKL